MAKAEPQLAWLASRRRAATTEAQLAGPLKSKKGQYSKGSEGRSSEGNEGQYSKGTAAKSEKTKNTRLSLALSERMYYNGPRNR